VPRIAQGERGFDVRGGRDPVDLLDAATAGGTRAGKNDPADELGPLEGDHLRDSPAEREAEEVDLVVAEGADEGDGVGGHLVDGVRHRSARRADAAVVERDHLSLGGDAVDDPRVPVVQDGGEVVQEDERHAGARAELAVGEQRSAGGDRAGGRGPPGGGRGCGLRAGLDERGPCHHQASVVRPKLPASSVCS